MRKDLTMANYTYEDVVPTLIENTTMKKMFINGVHRTYNIAPIDGYVLHDNAGNWQVQDEITGEWHEVEAYYRGMCSCGASYDFATNPREFYAVPANTVPENQIFGATNPPEVM